ncbi:MAG: GtrA family protein [Clostridia bacterium]|nr:GtrA family protein [Clostridia bacterium]
MTDKKKELMRAVKFTLFSISAGIIQTVSFTVLYELASVEYWVSYLVSLVLSVLWNFTLNRNITFKSAANIPIAMLKVAAFYVVFTPLSTWGGAALEQMGWNGFLVFVITMLLNFVLEFLYDRFFVFGSSLDTRNTK